MDHSKEIKVLGSSFPKPLKLPKYPKTCIIQSLISFYGRAASHFIWNVELNALDHFMCICAIELGIVGPNLSDFPQFHKNTKIAINHLSDSLYTSRAWVGLHVVWNKQFNTFDDFLRMYTVYLGFLGPISLTCSNTKYTKTGITGLSDGLYFCLRLHLMWNLELKT